MVWACFLGNRLGPIVFFNGTINIDAYIDILTNTFLPFVDVLCADGMTNIIFQQDNAHPHVSKKTWEFLENSMCKHGFIVIQWPTNSLDMNPIELL